MIEVDSPAPKGAPVYAYQSGILPIFCTPSQIQEAEETTLDSRAQAAMFFNTNFDRALKILNFPTSMIDMDLKEQWLQSGKAFVIQHLLSSLASHDMYIAIITKDMDDEATLYDLVRSDLKLACIRINHVLDEVWDGEYGILVNTKPKHQTVSTQQSFSRSADLILCLDVRIARKKEIFQKLNDRGQSGDTHPPVVWMIALGSVEMYAFDILKNHDLSPAVFKTESFRSLFSKDNHWPTFEDVSFETSIKTVASNLASWLIRSNAAKSNEYQFRSTQKLPQSFELGYLPQKQPPAAELPSSVTAPLIQSSEVDDDLEDMEISSDSEMANETDDSALENYLSNELLPIYELQLIAKKAPKELPQKDELISDNGKLVLDNLVEDYNKQIENLRQKYEKALADLHNAYTEKAKMAVADIKK
ncbi:hypothetical protein EDC96DRAFT_496816 [Choanephora cucurbitarum]|nr:hypothetical protein EDC96DRAFT_496816 [Choanephora cucurbitarum]